MLFRLTILQSYQRVATELDALKSGWNLFATRCSLFW